MTTRWLEPFRRPSDAARFLDLLVDRIERELGPVDTVDCLDGSITMSTDAVIRCDVIAAEIASIEPARWPDHIAWWVGRLGDVAPDRLVERFGAWSVARSALRMRLTSAHTGLDLVDRPLTRTVVWSLALEVPSAAVTVSSHLAAGWRVPRQELWRVAADNSRRCPPPTRIDAVVEGRRLHLLDGELFTTAAAADLRSIVPEIGDDGALVVAPCARTLLVRVIDGWDDIAEDAARLLLACLHFQETTLRPLPPAVLWYQGVGRLSGAIDLGRRPPPHGLPFSLDVVADEPLRSALLAGSAKAP